LTDINEATQAEKRNAPAGNSRIALNYLLIAALSFVIGILMGKAMFEAPANQAVTVNETQLRAIIESVFDERDSGAAANENDLWASFTHELASGASISVGVTDYYFPNAVAESEEGEERRERVVLGFRDAEAHTQEVSVSVSGTESFPVSLYAGVLLDDETPVYFEVSAPFMVGDTELGFHAGAVSAESDFYGTEDFALVNVGVTVSQEIAITEGFAPPVFVSYIVNPSKEGNRAYLVFGLSLSP